MSAAPAAPRLHRGAFWTASQRQASSLHEISYRACFKPQLPRFFITRLSQPGDRVLDPFSGRGTTALEAALLGRRVIANDANPLSARLCAPRFDPPTLEAVADRLATLVGAPAGALDGLDLSMFYHPDTEAALRRLRDALGDDGVDAWIRMVATNRLSGHSPGFFSVYSLPPNQAVRPEQQRRINARLGQTPPFRDTGALILTKTRSLLRNLSVEQRTTLSHARRDARFLTGDARALRGVGSGSVALTVTSPPFLDVVDYAGDNWLRCWFNHLDAEAIGRDLSVPRSLAVWSEVMGDTLRELKRVTRPGGHIAFEVGEVRRGELRLEEVVRPLGERLGLRTIGVWINTQRFTKTSAIWGVSNNRRGTNTNRVVVFQKP
ncbi:MAG: hypothetical protein K1X39_02650 [Thermoflexales bacterium]|nr:hypothetical protein [Thermoflexales bacterium]